MYRIVRDVDLQWSLPQPHSCHLGYILWLGFGTAQWHWHLRLPVVQSIHTKPRTRAAAGKQDRHREVLKRLRIVQEVANRITPSACMLAQLYNICDTAADSKGLASS